MQTLVTRGIIYELGLSGGGGAPPPNSDQVGIKDCKQSNT